MVAISIKTMDGKRVPVLGGRPVAEIVRACHDTTIDLGLAALAIPGLDRGTLEPVLIYCGEQRATTVNMALAWLMLREEWDTGRVFQELVAQLDPLVAVEKSPLPRDPATLGDPRLEPIQGRAVGRSSGCLRIRAETGERDGTPKKGV